VADPTESFNIQALRVFTAIFRAHPRPVIISAEVTHFPRPEPGSPDYSEKLRESGATITWLNKSGYLFGKLETTNESAFMSDAQLSPRGLAFMRAVNENVGRSFGEAAIEAVDSNNERELLVLSSLLMDELTR
jgi:hypothetical protein